MMVGMKTALDTDGDTEAICLYSETAGGALCGGLTYNGSSIVVFSEWVPNGTFTIAVNGSSQMNGGVDQATQWFATGVDGGSSYVADGSDDSYWSVFKFQLLENPDGYTDDYRFSPALSDIVPYIYQRDEGASTYNFYAGSTITLEGAENGLALSFVGAIAAILMAF